MNVRMSIAVMMLGAVPTACGGASPVEPSPLPVNVVSTTSPTYTVNGNVSATNGGQPLGGVAAQLGTFAGTTDADGAFRATLTQAGSYRLNLTGPGILARTLTLGVAGSRDVRVEAIATGGGFDLAFYRGLVRNGVESPAALQPLRRWTRTPQVYLKTVDEAGEAIHRPTLDVIESTIKDAIPGWTGGALSTPVVERGTGTREGTSGWITVKFPADNTALSGYCGRAQIAVDGGWIELGYHVPDTAAGSCRTATAVVAPHVIRHEIGHALGFYHTDTSGDLMYRSSWFSVTGLPTARELYHAAIAYRRPLGNVDPDSDPSGTVNLIPLQIP